MKITWSLILSVILSCLLIATIAILFIYPNYFQISRQLAPHPDFHYEVQGDNYSNGDSVGTWVDKDQRSWQCSFGNKLEFPFCYYQIFLGNKKGVGLDLSLYNEVEVDIKHQVSLESIRVYIRNYNSEYSKEVYDESASKYMRVQVDTKDFSSKLTLKLDEFQVADWWLQQHKLPRHLRFQALDNIILFGIQIQPEKAEEPIQYITVSSITMHGVWLSKEQLYYYIIIFWSGILLTLFIVQFMRLMNGIRRRESSLQKLTTDHMQLFEQKVSLEQLARIDPLTQINNRAGVDFYIEQQIEGNLRDSFVVGILDADHFKNLNDTYGHHTGDEVLKKIASILNSSIRKNDCVARWGGEEFLIILSSISLEKAYEIVDGIRLKIQEATFDVTLDNEIIPVKVTISAGIYKAKHALDIYEAIKIADNYLYKAKDMGRNKVEMN